MEFLNEESLKFLLTLNKTFASYQIYWVFKEAEIQLKLYTMEREREREMLVLHIILSRRSRIWGRRDHAVWGLEIASDASEWRDWEWEHHFFLGPICIYRPKYGILSGLAKTIWYGPIFKPERNNHVSVLAEVSER